MSEDTYSVVYGEVVLAKGMSLGTALILIEALMQKYYNESGLPYMIKREGGFRCE